MADPPGAAPASSEDVAEALGFAILPLRGKQLTAENINTLIRIVTHSSFSPSVTKSKFHNVYTLQKRREAVEGSAIETLGYNRQVVEYGGGAVCVGAGDGLLSSSEDSAGKKMKAKAPPLWSCGAATLLRFSRRRSRADARAWILSYILA
jgi:hypothetical protein